MFAQIANLKLTQFVDSDEFSETYKELGVFWRWIVDQTILKSDYIYFQSKYLVEFFSKICPTICGRLPGPARRGRAGPSPGPRGPRAGSAPGPPGRAAQATGGPDIFGYMLTWIGYNLHPKHKKTNAKHVSQKTSTTPQSNPKAPERRPTSHFWGDFWWTEGTKEPKTRICAKH